MSVVAILPTTSAIAVLAPGGSAPAADLIRDFLGRGYTFDAYQAWLDA